MTFLLRFIWGNYILLGTRHSKFFFFLMHCGIQRQADVGSAVCQVLTLHFLVAGTSYVLRVSSLSALAFIGLVALIILVGYSFIWYEGYNTVYYPSC